MDITGNSGTIFFEKGALVLYRRPVRHRLHGHPSDAILCRTFCNNLIFSTFRSSPNTAHFHLRNDAAVSFPFSKSGSMGMSAQHDCLALGEFLTEMTSGSSISFVLASMEEPPAATLIHREYRAVGNDESVPGALGFLKHLLYLRIVRMVEVQYQEGVRANVEVKSSLFNVLAEFFRHAFRHIFMVYLLRISSTDIMIALHRDERQTSEFLLECVHDIVEHLPVHIAVSAITLNEVTYLQCNPGILIRQAGASFQKPWTALTPHLAVAGELRPLDTVEPLHLFIIMGVVNRCRFRIEVSVSENYYGIAFVFRRFGIRKLRKTEKSDSGQGCR